MNEEKLITIDELEYKKLIRIAERDKEFQDCDFLIYISNGKILPILHPNYNDDRIFIKIKSMDDYNININGTEYKIQNAEQFYRIKELLTSNIQKLMDFSIQENKLFNKYILNQIKKQLIFKIGKLIIEVDGNVQGEIADFYDCLMDQISKIVTLPLKDYIEYKLNNSTEKLELGLSDACEVAFKEIQNGKYKDQFKDGFKAIKDFGNSWCFVPEYKDQNESEPIVRNLMVLIVSKNNLNFDWVDHMYIIKDLKNSNELEIPDAYRIN